MNILLWVLQVLLALHTGDAESYAIYRDAARTERVALRREPIYR